MTMARFSFVSSAALSSFLLFLLLLLGSSASSLNNNNDDDHTPDAIRDRITNLPGLEFDPGFEQYSGYLTVSKTRHLFYWFVTSQNDANNDPLVLWTNGGPGCSGLLGFGTEHGPFVMTRQGKNLRSNPYSWNLVANMLYMEQPAGVGYSYSDDDSDYITGDAQSAADNYEFILQFLKRFPKFQKNDFYIASESYGGHYMPQLTKQILTKNTDGYINFKGMLVGNPYVDPFSNLLTGVEAFYARGILQKPVYEKFVQQCSDPSDYHAEQCEDMLDDYMASLHNGINPYGLDYPACIRKSQEFASELQEKEEDVIGRHLQGPSSQAWKLLLHQWSSMKNKDKDDDTSTFIIPTPDRYKPCGEHHLYYYLNRQDVRQALHVRDVHHNRHWHGCTDDIQYSTKDVYTSQISLYRELIEMAVNGTHDLNIMIFSGDDDSVCATAGTQYWIWDQGVQAYEDSFWKSWHVDNQAAGFYTKFNLGEKSNARFSFATVHGAGHEVPSYRPKQALILFQKYLHQEW